MISKFQDSNEIHYQGREFMGQRKVIHRNKTKYEYIWACFRKITKILNWKNYQHYEKNPLRLGGANVQIDETKLNHDVKLHRGGCPKLPSWDLCIVDTSNQPRTSFVRPKSIIHTDEAQVA